jgi:hypothetical protein
MVVDQKHFMGAVTWTKKELGITAHSKTVGAAAQIYLGGAYPAFNLVGTRILSLRSHIF